MLLVGLLLTSLWMGLFNWSKQPTFVGLTSVASVPSVQSPGGSEVWEKMREERRRTYATEQKRYETAAQVLGFLHYLPLPVSVLLGAVCYDGMKRRFGHTGSVACSRVATTGIVLCSVGAMMFSWRLAYVPLIDWIWQASGGQMVDYERNYSEKLGSSRRTTGGVGVLITSVSWSQSLRGFFLRGCIPGCTRQTSAQDRGQNR